MKIRLVSFGTPVRVKGKVLSSADAKDFDISIDGDLVMLRPKGGDTLHATTIFNIRDMEFETDGQAVKKDENCHGTEKKVTRKSQDTK